MSSPFPKTTPPNRPSSDKPAAEEAGASRSVTAHCSPDERNDIRERISRLSSPLPDFASLTRATKKRRGEKRGGTPTDAGLPAVPVKAQRTLCAGGRALACRRSTTALPLDSRIPRHNPDQVWLSERLNGGFPPAAPRAKSHSAGGLMSEPPERRGDKPSTRRHRARSRQPDSLSGVLSRRARIRRF